MCEVTVDMLLTEWGMAKYIPKFAEHEVDAVALISLTPYHIEKLVAPIGDQVKLLEKIKTFKSILQSDASVLNTPKESDKSDPGDSPSSRERSPQIISEGTDSAESSISLFEHPVPKRARLDENPVREGALTPDHTPLPFPTPTDEDSDQEDDVDSPRASTAATNKEAALSSSSSNPKPKQQLKRSDDTWQELLKSTAQGQIISCYYECHDHKLTERARRQLVDLVINLEFERLGSYDIPHSRLSQLANEIVKEFPSETKETYYIPFSKVGNKKISAKGKLVMRYWNLRRAVGTSKISQSVQEEGTDLPDSEDTTQNLLWLRNNIFPAEEVLEKWKATFQARRKTLLATSTDDADKNNKAYNYIQGFPFLKEPMGYSLLEADFNELYGEKSLKLFAVWPALAPKVIEAAKGYIRKDSNVASLCAGVKDSTDNRLIETVALLLLPYLFPTAICHRSKKTVWKPSKKEVADGFLLHLKTSNELQTTLTARRKKLEALGVSAQALAVVVGSDLAKPEQCYVCVDRHVYNINCPVKAVDVCFKVTFGLHLQYPLESENVWLLVQKFIYDISTRFDKKSSVIYEVKTSLGL